MVSRLGRFRASKADESSTQLRRRCYWYTTAHWRWEWRLSLCGHHHGGLWQCFISFSDTCLSVIRFFSVWPVSTWSSVFICFPNFPFRPIGDKYRLIWLPYCWNDTRMYAFSSKRDHLAHCMIGLMIFGFTLSEGANSLYFILCDVPNGGRS